MAAAGQCCHPDATAGARVHALSGSVLQIMGLRVAYANAVPVAEPRPDRWKTEPAELGRRSLTVAGTPGRRRSPIRIASGATKRHEIVFSRHRGIGGVDDNPLVRAHRRRCRIEPSIQSAIGQRRDRDRHRSLGIILLDQPDMTREPRLLDEVPDHPHRLRCLKKLGDFDKAVVGTDQLRWTAVATIALGLWRGPRKRRTG